MLPEFLYARVNAADCFAGGIVLAYRKTLPSFNRKGCNLLLENLTCNSGHGLIGITSFAFAVGALNNLTVRFLEISIQRFVVVTKGEVVHREAFVCRGHAIGCDCHFELFLLDLDIEALPLQVGLRLDGIKSLSADFFSRSYMCGNGNHIFRRVLLPILSNKFIFRAPIMERHALFIDVFQRIGNVLFTNFWDSHATPPSIFLFWFQIFSPCRSVSFAIISRLRSPRVL